MFILLIVKTEISNDEELFRQEPDETALSARVGRDPAAFQEFYERYFSRIYNYIFYRVGEAAAAEDLTAKVFEQALEKVHRFDPRRAAFRAWLFGIARNTLNNHLRFKMRRKRAPLEAAARIPDRNPLPEQQYIRNETRRELLNALAALSQKERDMLGLKFAGGLTNRKIAELTGMSESATGTALFRAIERLRKALGIEVK